MQHRFGRDVQHLSLEQPAGSPEHRRERRAEALSCWVASAATRMEPDGWPMRTGPGGLIRLHSTDQFRLIRPAPQRPEPEPIDTLEAIGALSLMAFPARPDESPSRKSMRLRSLFMA